jgi:3-hydroxy-9,10-secoandrosta-1,3,5(10)-triene-9,17-dione monooxygenase
MARAALDEYERVMPTKLTTFPPIVPRHLSRDFQLTLGVALGMIVTAEAAVLQVGQRYMNIAVAAPKAVLLSAVRRTSGCMR